MRWNVPALASETGTAPAPHGTQRPPFSQEALIQNLLNFIVADDQVGQALLMFGISLTFFVVYKCC